MNELHSGVVARRSYTPPELTRVYIDPVRELLLQTTCVFNVSGPSTCENNPVGCTGGGGAG